MFDDIPPQRAPDPPSLVVWRLKLDVPEDEVRALAEVLSADELQRTERLRFEHDRTRFVAAHGKMRRIIAAHVDCEPRELRFETEANGKPRLVAPQALPAVHFNLSHSGDWAVLAVGRQTCIGADVEQVRPVDELNALAARMFSPAERAVLAAIDGQERFARFFAMWTRREATAKAVGKGVGTFLGNVEIEPADPNERASFRVVSSGPLAGIRGECLELVPGYPAAVAVQDSQIELAAIRFA